MSRADRLYSWHQVTSEVFPDAMRIPSQEEFESMSKLHSLGEIRFIPHRDRSVELLGVDWAPVSFAENNQAAICRNAAGRVFIATKRGSGWLDQAGLERDPVEFLMGIQ